MEELIVWVSSATIKVNETVCLMILFIYNESQLERKDMDVNDHERLP